MPGPGSVDLRPTVTWLCYTTQMSSCSAAWRCQESRKKLPVIGHTMGQWRVHPVAYDKRRTVLSVYHPRGEGLRGWSYDPSKCRSHYFFNRAYFISQDMWILYSAPKYTHVWNKSWLTENANRHWIFCSFHVFETRWVCFHTRDELHTPPSAASSTSSSSSLWLLPFHFIRSRLQKLLRQWNQA